MPDARSRRARHQLGVDELELRLGDRAVSESCASLTANAYSRNPPCRVTLNRASDDKNRWNRPVLRSE